MVPGVLERVLVKVSWRWRSELNCTIVPVGPLLYIISEKGSATILVIGRRIALKTQGSQKWCQK